MENPRSQALARLKESNNVLVTVSSNPSVDQLAGAIGLTLLLNKLGKHATAVFSGQIPSTIEFLQPENTLKNTTDSLRDFIIALDKSKADKIRYKVEDQHVKIFITPYHTTIGAEDLEFSQGDFNVDAVVALGVHEQKDLDQAIVAHGRILHDATIVSVNISPGPDLGSISWVDGSSSSLCEMLTGIAEEMQANIFDAQMATAFLTGIVSETDRFSNQKTSANTMTLSAKLITAGANQQLVASKLQAAPPQNVPPVETPQEKTEDSDPDPDGTLSIDHPGPKPPDSDDDSGEPPVNPEHQIDIDDHGTMRTPADITSTEDETPIHDKGLVPPPQTHLNQYLTDPPTQTDTPMMAGGLGGSSSTAAPATTDQLNLPPIGGPLLDHNAPAASPPPPPFLQPYSPPPPVQQAQPISPPASPQPTTPVATPQPVPLASPSPAPSPWASSTNQTLDDIERAVDSPHQDHTVDSAPDPTAPTADLESLRQAVEAAAASSLDSSVPPQPDTLNITPSPPPLPDQPAPSSSPNDYFDVTKIDSTTGLPSQPSPFAQSFSPSSSPPSSFSPNPPPPVPPPMMPPSIPTSGQQPLPNAENDNDTQDPLTAL